MQANNDSLPKNWKQFPDGSLLRIVLNDFLTYEYTVCIPGENLNLILGHNGSGKSSIICGLCLVFGGSPKLLGRSEKISEYIRYGCKEAYVEVLVADQKNGPKAIRLTLRVGKSPEFRLNGAVTTQANIKDFAAQYNIQIDNPCAFLAQDKVKSFSEQTPIELLFNTEKAASADLLDLHHKLIQERKDSTQIEDKCVSAENCVKQIEDDIVKLEPRVENYRQKKKMQTRLRLLEQKIAIKEFEEADDLYQQEVEKCDKARENLDTAQHKMSKSQARIKKYNSESETQKDIINKNKHKCREILGNLDRTMDKDYLQNKLASAKRNYDSQRQEQKKLEKEKSDTKRRVEMYEGKLKEAEAELTGYADFMKQSREDERKNFEEDKFLRDEEDSISKKSYSLRTMKEKRREKENEKYEIENRRFRVMESTSRDAASAWKYYTQNKGLFKDKIYVPMMHIVLKSQDSAKIIENTVGARDWCMFVCSNKEDELLINDSSKGWRINSTVVRPENVHLNQINMKLPDELREIGFQYLTSECIDAPPTLKQYLCNVFRLNNIPVGDGKLERNIGEVAEKMAQTRYSVFLTPNIRTQINVSKYSGEVLQSQGQMRSPSTWKDHCFSKETQISTANDDLAAEMEALQLDISESTKSLHEKRLINQKTRDRLKQEQADWRNKKQAAATAKNNVTNEVDRLAQLELEHVDMDKAKQELEKEQKAAQLGAKKMFEDCIQQHKKYIELFVENGKHLLIKNQSDHKSAKLEYEINEMRDELNELRTVKSMAESQLQSTFNKKRSASDNLKEKCGLKLLKVDKMDNNEKKILQKLNELFVTENVPDDEDTLEKQLNAERTRLKLAEDSSDDGSVEDEKQMDRLKRSLLDEVAKRDKLFQTKDNVHEKLGEAIDAWKKNVEDMIDKINENYRDSFQKMGCLGEVHLDLPENTLDIENYGIMIMVCFRTGEKMKRLDQKVQSGGERSVSTMLYLLALQQLCPVPFRCVDEINQGMDPTNERKVFEIMVNLWSGDGSIAKTQYFLLTPKLLHGLPMNERVTVQVVHSIVPKVYTTWNSAKHIETMKAAAAS